jgi:hypothetical protein
MRCDQQQHRFYAAVNVHAKTMFTHVLDHAGLISVCRTMAFRRGGGVLCR